MSDVKQRIVDAIGNPDAMTTRDWFAGQALKALLNGENHGDQSPGLDRER